MLSRIYRRLEPWLVYRPRPLVAYAIVIGLTLLALGVRLLIYVLTPASVPFATFFPAILMSALIGGAGPGLMALGLSLLTSWFWIVAPQLNSDSLRLATIVSVVAFAAIGSLLVLVGTLLRRLIDRQLRTQRQLLRSRERLAAALLAGDTGTWRWDIATDAMTPSPELLRLLGAPPGHVIHTIGDFWALMVDPKDRADAEKRLRHCAEAGGAFQTEFRTASRGEGEPERWWEMRASRMLGGDGEPARLIGACIDITRRRRLEMDLQAALAAQALLLQEVNHRIKNNLQIVASFLQLQASGADPATRRELEAAHARVRAVANIHQDLYQTKQYDRIEIAGFLQRLASEIGSIVYNGTTDVRVQAEPAMLPLDAAIQIGLIANELITNAIKYAYDEGNHGPIIVRLVSRDGIRLEVEDRGRGLPEDFYTDRSGGLGMKIVRALAAGLKGTVSMENLAPGTRFMVDMPELQEMTS